MVCRILGVLVTRCIDVCMVVNEGAGGLVGDVVWKWSGSGAFKLDLVVQDLLHRLFQRVKRFSQSFLQWVNHLVRVPLPLDLATHPLQKLRTHLLEVFLNLPTGSRSSK